MANWTREQAREFGKRGRSKQRATIIASNGDGNAAPIVDPAAAAAAIGAPDEPADRIKRPKGPGDDIGAGSGTDKKEKSASLDLSAIAGILQSTHDFIAFVRSEPHWKLTDADANAFGKKVQLMARHFSVAVAQKYADFYAFGMAVFVFEAPRIMMSAELARQRRAAPHGPRGPAEIFTFNPPPPRRPAPAAPPPSASPDESGGPGFVADGVDAPLGGVQ